jgi:hypothetical protein
MAPEAANRTVRRSFFKEVKGMAIRLSLVIGLAILVGLPVGISSQPAIASPSMTDSLADAITVVGSDTVTAGTFGSERVRCPAGMIAVGGGVDLGNVSTMKVTSSAPVFGPSGDRLISQPDGINPAPTGWQASARNDDPRNLALKVAVICAPLSDVSTVVGSDTVTAGTFGSERVQCPAGMIAVGGGVDLGNVSTMKVTSSAPVFGPSGDRLISQSDGTNLAPTGWQASARNDDPRNLALKVAAICGRPGHRAFLPLAVYEFRP